jgi:RNA polymerase subunit RPABC4/transcription elongation factor Spt4
MWETIKNDPILKTVTIIILSVLGFGFAFNIMFGQNSGGMEHGGAMGSGYSMGNTLSYIFILAFKLLLIVLVMFAFIALYKFARKHLFEGGEVKVIDKIKKDPVLKGITVVGLLIIAFGLVYYLFSGILGFGSNRYVMMNGYPMASNSGYGMGSAGLFAILLKFLLAASIFGLIIGLVMYIKQNYGKEISEKLSAAKFASKKSITCSNCGAAVSDEFKFCPQCGGNTKELCKTCGGELKKEWKCCPECGNEKEVVKEEAVQDNSAEKEEKVEEVVSEESVAEPSADTLTENLIDSLSNNGGTAKPSKGKKS